ncbi:hypothetical protein OAG68_01895 [bacterium]|nr:hypothetical protein [bacterium]
MIFTLIGLFFLAINMPEVKQDKRAPEITHFMHSTTTNCVSPALVDTGGSNNNPLRRNACQPKEIGNVAHLAKSLSEMAVAPRA